MATAVTNRSNNNAQTRILFFIYEWNSHIIFTNKNEQILLYVLIMEWNDSKLCFCNQIVIDTPAQNMNLTPDRQGYLGGLKDRTTAELKELLERQEKILSKRYKYRKHLVVLNRTVFLFL